MNDPILKHRLQLLEDNLRTALETTKSFQEDLAELGMTFQRRGELSDAFTNVAQGQLRTLQRFLAKLEQMDTRSAWKEYGSLCEQSSQIYREVLEAMLGLAIRRKRMDNAICTVADESNTGGHVYDSCKPGSLCAHCSAPGSHEIPRVDDLVASVHGSRVRARCYRGG
jgi:hypothetical protein